MQDLSQTIADYGAAWQERDVPRRQDLLSRCFAGNGRYVDPTAEIVGRDNLSTHIGKVLSDTDGRVEVTSALNTHHDVVHFTWHMVGTDGAIMVAGHDFARVNADGMIENLAGFFGSPPPLD